MIRRFLWLRMNNPNDNSSFESPSRKKEVPHGSVFAHGLSAKLLALGIIVFCGVFGIGLAYWLKWYVGRETITPSGTQIPASLFRGWGKPDLVLLLSGQQHGYMLPCGCSNPQLGGLERRYNFLQLLKGLGWPVVALDLGDLAQKQGPVLQANVQGFLKYQYSLLSLQQMGYLGAGVGEYDAALGWERIATEWADQEPKPAMLLANYVPLRALHGFKLRAVDTNSEIKVGVTNIIGPRVAKTIKLPPNVTITDVKQAMSERSRAMRDSKMDLPILLYHGLATGRDEEALHDAAFASFPIIVCLCEEEEAPPDPLLIEHPREAVQNLVLRLGHKGKSIGVVGVFRTGGGNAPFTFKYQRVEMGEEYVTPEVETAQHPIMRLMEEYTRTLKQDDYLSRYIRTPHLLQQIAVSEGERSGKSAIPKYIGSEKCADCHEYAYKVWKDSKHNHAYQTLVEARHPSLRQFDGECIVCHTVGFGYRTGFADEKKTPHLKDVGCESCHGPGSLHANNPQDEEWQKRMNQPWRDKSGDKKDLAIELSCRICHDADNDVNWVPGAFKKKWEKIAHPTP
jgi:hypothetical protein